MLKNINQDYNFLFTSISGLLIIQFDSSPLLSSIVHLIASISIILNCRSRSCIRGLPFIDFRFHAAKPSYLRLNHTSMPIASSSSYYDGISNRRIGSIKLSESIAFSFIHEDSAAALRINHRLSLYLHKILSSPHSKR